MTKKSKGISPLVAVIMLIAFTMIVAGILAGWATRFATEQRATLEKCVRANILIRRATYSYPNLTLMMYNPGTVPLRGFDVMLTYTEDGPPIPSTWSITDSVTANTFETFEHNISCEDADGDYCNETVDYVEVRSRECQGAYDMVRSYDIVGLPSK